MWDCLRGGSIALAGLVVGVAAGYCIWADRAVGDGGFERRYAEGARVRVERAVDGDTIQLEDRLMVRYRGCDAPEVFRFVRDPKPGAEEASARNRELVEGTWVRLRFPPPGRTPVDEHGRLLANVYLDVGEPRDRTMAGETIAETLVREGFARASSYEMDGAERERMREAEAEARAAKRGVWSEEEAAGGDEAPFVASRNGKYIHRADCEYAKRIGAKNAMKFYTLDAALSTGRGRCPGCLAEKMKARGGEEK